MTVGDRIRKKRSNLGISQKELAEKINVKKQTMNKYEMNIITNIPSDKIEEIARVLNTSPCYLMGWTEENAIETSKNFDARLQEIINYYSDMSEDGKHLLLVQAELYCKQFPKPKTNVRAI